MAKLKIGAILVILLLSITTISGVLVQSNFNSSSVERSNEFIGLSPELAASSQGETDTVMIIGDTTLTVSILDPGRHLLMKYETDGVTSTLEFIVSIEENGKYQTSILLDAIQFSIQILDSNILEPILPDSPSKISQPASVGGFSGITAQYTYRWWDGVKQVTGPSYLVKYHHPDRTYYQIGKWQDVSIIGYHASHNQFSNTVSAYLIAGGWAVICFIQL